MNPFRRLPCPPGIVLFVLVILFCIDHHAIQAQPEFNFKPMRLHSERSRSLIKDVDAQLSAERIKTASLKGDIWIQSIQTERSHLFKRLVRGGAFIDSDTLDQFLYMMLDRIVSANALEQKKRTILVLNSPDANAFCYGPGLFVVTVGLIGKINSEEEFAFILSHELAHDELHHIEKKLKRELAVRSAKNSETPDKRKTEEETFQDAVAEISSLLYKSSNYNRACELEADSMALKLLTTSGYTAQGAVNAMNTLDRATEPKHASADFFQPLHFSNFPFKNYWLDNRLSVYSHKAAPTFFFAYDSLMSHPEIELRKTKFISYIEDYEVDRNDERFEDLLHLVIPLAEFQTVEAAYQTRQYDIALFQILQLQRLYVGNRYLVSRSAKVMIDIFEAKNENKLTDYVAKYTRNYGSQLKEVNNLLFNISKEEAVEIAFHIVNNQSNFNTTDKSHYYLLWQICRLSQRDQVRTRIEQAYENKFGKHVETYSYR